MVSILPLYFFSLQISFSSRFIALFPLFLALQLNYIVSPEFEVRIHTSGLAAAGALLSLYFCVVLQIRQDPCLFALQSEWNLLKRKDHHRLAGKTTPQYEYD